jgi:hypothetical protein
MNGRKAAIGIVWACVCAGAQTPEVRPQIAGRPVQEGQVTVVYLAPRFATAIRMPDAVNSVVLGDPASFTAEHSEHEPQIVFVKPITEKAAQTNLLISTSHGHQANLLLISQGDTASARPNVDFVMRYRPAGRFIVEPSVPSASVAQTVALTDTAPEKSAAPPVRPNATAAAHSDNPAGQTVSFSLGGKPVAKAEESGIQPQTHSADPSLDLAGLLRRQEQAPLPLLYGEKPGLATAGRQILQAGVSEVIDQGREVIVLFSVLNFQRHAVELMPPQVQLGGKVKKGAIVHHLVWSNSEQLPVEDFRISRRRIGPGERADGVLIFQRPSFKQSNETLLLQIADSGAVDRPALAPIGFGISVIREKRGE